MNKDEEVIRTLPLLYCNRVYWVLEVTLGCYLFFYVLDCHTFVLPDPEMQHTGGEV